MKSSDAWQCVNMLGSIHAVTFEIDRNPTVIAAAVMDILKCDERAFAAFSRESRQVTPHRGPSRRREQRRIVKTPISICPVVSLGRRAKYVGQTTAIGLALDLSSRGVGIAYDCPVRSRFVVIEFDLYGVGPLQMLTELRWARKRGEHDYLAGGLFAGVVTEAH